MKFKEIFEGNNSAYGQLILSGTTNGKGKADGKAFIKRQPITDDLWQDHIDGKDPALGVIPINENNECKWGCIDVDVYNIDHLVLMRNIKGLSFPLVTFRSKSGGAHFFLVYFYKCPRNLFLETCQLSVKRLQNFVFDF